MKKIKIDSTKNQLIKKIKKDILKKRLCLIEGSKIVADLINNNFKCEFLLYDVAKKRECSSIIEKASTNTLIETNDAVISKIAELVPNSDIIALAKVREVIVSIDDMIKNDVILYLHKIQDPGNLGSIIRTCSALDINLILLSEGCASPFNSKVIRASSGTSLLLKISKVDSITSVIDKLKEYGYLIYYTSQKGEFIYHKANYNSRFLLLLGSEGSGLPREIITQCHRGICLPMANRLESLNVSVCAAVILFEAKKQRNLNSL